MATREAKRAREVVADGRIEAATATLADRFAISLPAPAYTPRDTDLREIARSERMADLLEGIVAATGPTGADVTTTITGSEVTTTATMTTDLTAMTRAELDAYAATLGIEAPEKLPNKGAVIEAIEEALTAPDDDAGDAVSDAPQATEAGGPTEPDADTTTDEATA